MLLVLQLLLLSIEENKNNDHWAKERYIRIPQYTHAHTYTHTHAGARKSHERLKAECARRLHISLLEAVTQFGQAKHI